MSDQYLQKIYNRIAESYQWFQSQPFQLSSAEYIKLATQVATAATTAEYLDDLKNVNVAIYDGNVIQVELFSVPTVDAGISTPLEVRVVD